MTKLNLQEISDLLAGKTVYDDEGEEIIVDDLNYVSVSQKKFRAQYKLLKIASKYSPAAAAMRKKLENNVILNAYMYKNMLNITNDIYRFSWFNVDAVQYFMESEFGTKFYTFKWGFFDKTLVKSELINFITHLIKSMEENKEIVKKRQTVITNRTTGTKSRITIENWHLQTAEIREIDHEINYLKQKLKEVESDEKSE